MTRKNLLQAIRKEIPTVGVFLKGIHVIAKHHFQILNFQQTNSKDMASVTLLNDSKQESFKLYASFCRNAHPADSFFFPSPPGNFYTSGASGASPSAGTAFMAGQSILFCSVNISIPRQSSTCAAASGTRHTQPTVNL